jgi:hypothetical protein
MVTVMPIFTDEDRARFIAEARATLERTDVSAMSEPLPPHDDPLQRWARGMPKPEEPPPPRKLDTAPVDWEQRIAQAVADEREFMMQVVAGFVAEMRDSLIDEIEQAYGRQFNIVRLDIDALRHEIRKFAGAGVIELPSFLGSERHRTN